MTITREGDWWVDGRNNRWGVATTPTIEDAERKASTLTECTYCIGCTDCTGCAYCTDCTRCTGCTRCTRCTGCAYCTGCTDCSDCTGCIDCSGCSGCAYCTDCIGCADCTDCINCTDCTGQPQIYHTGRIGSRGGVTTIYQRVDGTVSVACGCWRGSLDEFAARVECVYPDGHEHRIEYDGAIAKARELFKGEHDLPI